MKKWLTVLITVLVLIVAGLYIFIPAQVELHQWKTARCTVDGAFRSLSDLNNWTKWWKGEGFFIEGGSAHPSFRYKDCSYQVTKILYDDIEVKIAYPGGTTLTNLLISPLNKDSVRLNWSGPLPVGQQPLQRWRQYHLSKELASNVVSVLSRLRIFLNDYKNIYGISVNRQKVRDTTLISLKRKFPRDPSTKDVDELLRLLKNYVKKQGAQETGYPMLHVAEAEDHTVNTMVAIPVNKVLQGNNSGIAFKRMVAGNILVTEVRGGPATIKNAREQLENYVHDYGFESPAIPFESLITNRPDEKDTSKWVTKLYYPVF